MNATIILYTVASLVVGGAAGSAITYQVTSQAHVTCLSPDATPDRGGIPPAFFHSQPHPTTGGGQY
jgi:hypothetical protein